MKNVGSVLDVPLVVVFDVNETLLDLTPLRESVAETLGGRPDLADLWFSMTLQYSMVHSVIDDYREFSHVGVASLMMLAERTGDSISRTQAHAAVALPVRRLSAHSEVGPALAALDAAGFHLVALTNSSRDTVNEQLEHAGIHRHFRHVLTTDTVRAHKPDPRPYRHALVCARVRADEALMVAAQPWDLAGARASGLHTAFVARSGAILYPDLERPDHVVGDLGELVTVLTDRR